MGRVLGLPDLEERYYRRKGHHADGILTAIWQWDQRGGSRWFPLGQDVRSLSLRGPKDGVRPQGLRYT